MVEHIAAAAESGKAPAVGYVPRPTWAEVDLGAVVENYRLLSSLLKETSSPSGVRSPRIIPVVKAEAYGHGAVPVARALSAAGAGLLAVGLVEEGVTLRRAGIAGEILVLEGAWPGQEKDALRHNLALAVFAPESVRRLDLAASSLFTSVSIHIKINTGMARLGVQWNLMEPLLAALGRAGRLRLEGTFSHLATADEDDSAYVLEQLRRFEAALADLRRAGLDPGEIHFGNSAGLLHYKQLRQWSARPGIALYGYPPAPSRSSLPFRRALTLKSRIARIGRLETGESVGYNRRFICSRPSRIGTLPIGYADGYPYGLKGSGRVIIRDQWASVAGAISMDMIAIDLTDMPDVEEGEEVVLLGATANCRMDATDWADRLGTIPYEVLCGIQQRVPRVYI
jgi:alanine racemase